jgi:2-amino-4-hydroxy-6-hydroxymethyldihydropteridine diphosphokinase
VKTIAVALGSNLGDRHAHLAYARDRLSGLLVAPRFSKVIETIPEGMPGLQPLFLNAAAVGGSDLEPLDLLTALHAIEDAAGRSRPSVLAARTLDLDLILFGDEVINGPALMVPHPRFRLRRFVLEPLAEIAPRLRDPVTNKTVAELLEALASRR